MIMNSTIDMISQAKKKAIRYILIWVVPVTIIETFILTLLLIYLPSIISLGTIQGLVLLALIIILIPFLVISIVRGYMTFYYFLEYDMKVAGVGKFDIYRLKDVVEKHYGKCDIKKIFHNVWMVNITFPGQQGKVVVIKITLPLLNIKKIDGTKVSFKKALLLFIKPPNLLTDDEIISIIPT